MDDSLMISFQIISEAGDGRSKAMLAVEAYEALDFEKGDKLLEEAKEALRNAHQLQTDLINRQVKGEKIETSVILIHGQDHFAMATIAVDLAQLARNIYKKFDELERR